MARTALTAEKFTTAGLAPTPVTPDASGVSFRSSGRQILMVVNGSGSSINVTPQIAKQIEGLSVTSPARAVPAGATRFFGPFSDAYNQLDGKDTVFVDLSAVATVTVSLLEMP
jgi:hypothetical protein